MKLLLLALAKPLFASSILGFGMNYRSVQVEHVAREAAAVELQRVELEVEVQGDEHEHKTLEVVPQREQIAPPVEESPKAPKPNN